jgi:hypothetical protein
VYVFDRMQELFGKEALSRFNLFCTFAENTNPKAAGVLSKLVKFNNVYGMNNSWLEGNQNDDLIMNCFF